MSKTQRTFEESLARLEEIVKQMEQGNVPLADSLALFSEGTALIKSCGELLDKAEQQVVQLVKSADGSPEETEYIRNDGI